MSTSIWGEGSGGGGHSIGKKILRSAPLPQTSPEHEWKREHRNEMEKGSTCVLANIKKDKGPLGPPKENAKRRGGGTRVEAGG